MVNKTLYRVLGSRGFNWGAVSKVNI